MCVCVSLTIAKMMAITVDRVCVCVCISFQKMIENLIGKEMLESCEPPTEEQLEELRLLPLPRQHKASSSEVSAVSAAAKSVGGRKLTSDEEPKIVERSESQNSDVSSDESLVSESKPVASRWGLDEDGNPLFYRFTSIAFQHVRAESRSPSRFLSAKQM